MKNIFKYMLVAAAGVLVFASCQELENFNTTIDAAPVLAYTPQGGLGNIHTTKVAHAPVGSFGSYEVIFPVQCNSGSHKSMQVEVVYSAEAAQTYASEHSTAKLPYNVLPAENLQIEKYIYNAEEGAAAQAPVLTLPENARFSSDSVKVSLTGDLSQLTEKRYVAALTFKPSQYATSEDLGTYYLEVLTEINCIRPLSNMSEMAGLQPADRSAWEYIEGLSGNVTSRKSLPAQPTEVVVDMKDTYILTGLQFGLYSSWGGAPVYSSIEYSVDGETWEQAGTPDESALTANNNVNVAFYGYIEARYVKFTVDASAVSSWSRYINGFNIFYVESTEPTLYIDNREFSGKIQFSDEGAVSTVSAKFVVKVAPIGTSAINFTMAVDNSLVAAYNTEKGTSFGTIDAANVKVSGASSIAAAAVSSEEVEVTLQGDLSSYNDENGYLIPVKLQSDASVSATLGVVYITVYPKVAQFKVNFEESALGSWVADRSAWSASEQNGSMYGGGFNTLFDGDLSTYIDLYTWSGNIQYTVDLGAVLSITGICLQHNEQDTYYQQLNSMQLEISTDGSSYKDLETVSREDGTLVVSGTKNMVGFLAPKDVRYIRITPNNTESTLAEFNVYTK
ncbi:MAG: discoidin domain-containing protein [Bacteroidales bacterium]|nr:discoidin domain-containing protein [Bacteroidales bacterium]